MEKIPVGVLGATGWIGQHYVHLLQNHPLFELVALGSTRRGKFSSLIQQWNFPSVPPDDPVTLCDDVKAFANCQILFSALPASCFDLDRYFAKQGAFVIAHGSLHREQKDVALAIATVNEPQIKASIETQRSKGFKGAILAKPNCVVIPLVLALDPLHQLFGLEKIAVTSLQSISGAGFKNLSSLEIHDTVLPDIKGEKEKIMAEPRKIWDENIPMMVHTFRVPVKVGHTLKIAFSLKKKTSKQQILETWSQSKIIYHEKKPCVFDPMSVVCSHLHPETLFDYSLCCYSHNAIRGGAGSGLLIAETLKNLRLL